MSHDYINPLRLPGVTHVLKSAVRQRGASIAEFLVAVPALLVLGLGTLQTAQVYNAKTTLNYATFEAARIGAVTGASTARMRQELGVRLAPVFGGDGSPAKAAAAIQRSSVDVQDRRYTQLDILNPTKQAFDDFAVVNPKTNKKELPNDNLANRSRAVGPSSGVNIQDANLLKIETTYGYELKIPIIDTVVPAILKQLDPTNSVYYNAKRIPIQAVATVRMQSPALAFGEATSPDGGDGTPPSGTTPGEPTPGGTGTTPTDPSTGPGDQGGPTTGPTEPVNPDGTEQPTQPTTPPVVTPTPTPPTDNSPPTCEGKTWDSGLLGIWKNAYNFADGLIKGLGEQVAGIWELLSSPIETVKGLYSLAKAVQKDPVGTLKAIGAALGQDVYKLVGGCGPYDMGKVIGENLSPAFMLKLATKLSKFKKLEDAIAATKKDFGCASFVENTQILTSNGPVPIRSLSVGDVVYSRAEDTYFDSDKEIKVTFNREASEYYRLITELETLQVTGEHPLWVQGKGWTEVKDINAGDAIAALDGDILVIHNELVTKKVKVYNFSVVDTPSYFAGRSKVWAHNADCDVSFQKSGKNPELNKPKPNSRVYVDGKHTYITDDKGRTTGAKSKITRESLDEGVRDCYRTRKVGNCGLSDDDGGHLIATKLGGIGEEINLVPQNMNLNRGKWKAMENEWGKAAAEGKTVEVDIEIIYSGDKVRPDRFIVKTKIDGVRQPDRPFKNQKGG